MRYLLFQLRPALNTLCTNIRIETLLKHKVTKPKILDVK